MVLRNLDWQSEAACRDNPQGEWFPEGRVDDGRTTYVPPAVRRAIAICNTCPVQVACREYALAADEKVGVWGGLLSVERRKERRRRGDAERRSRQAQARSVQSLQ